MPVVRQTSWRTGTSRARAIRLRVSSFERAGWRRMRLMTAGVTFNLAAMLHCFGSGAVAYNDSCEAYGLY